MITKFLSVFVSVVMMLLFSGETALGDISATKHNLGSTGPGNKTTDTGEICVFCHTPHGADTGAVVPLWNRGISTPPTYQTYASLGTTTLDAQQGTIGSISVACLSCHDGSMALDVLINAPGSGGYNASGADQTWTFSSFDIFTAAQGITFVGTDLRNDHPISIQYGGGGITATNPTAPTTDPDFHAPKNTTIGSTTVWWVDTTSGTANQRDKTDMILYTRSGAYTGQTDAEPFVECGSCHDPHRSDTNTFLRLSNTGSALCLACHDK